MRRIRVDVQNVIINVIVRKRNDVNVSVIKNVFAKEKSKRIDTNVDISQNSRIVIGI